jgi:hypothetical protein
MDSQSSGSRFVRLDPYSALIFSPSPSSIKQQHWNTRESFLKRSCWHKFRHIRGKLCCCPDQRMPVEKICREFAFRCLSELRAWWVQKLDFPNSAVGISGWTYCAVWAPQVWILGMGTWCTWDVPTIGVGRNWGANKLILFDINHPFFPDV